MSELGEFLYRLQGSGALNDLASMVGTAIGEHLASTTSKAALLPMLHKSYTFHAYFDGAGFTWYGWVDSIDYPYVRISGWASKKEGVYKKDAKIITLNLNRLTSWEWDNEDSSAQAKGCTSCDS